MKTQSPHDRLQAVLPKVQTEIETAAITDRVVHVRIRRDGSVDGVRLFLKHAAPAGKLSLVPPTETEPTT